LINFDEIAERVKNDPHLRSMLQTARAWGVSPRHFLCQGVARSFTYEYDHDRLIRMIEHVEPEWQEEDRLLAFALQDYEATLCKGCGHPLEETTKPEHDGAYRADLPIRCHRCTAAGAAQEAYGENPQPEALMFPIILDERLIIKPEDNLEFE